MALFNFINLCLLLFLSYPKGMVIKRNEGCKITDGIWKFCALQKRGHISTHTFAVTEPFTLLE
jgi:hypothetical protein